MNRGRMRRVVLDGARTLVIAIDGPSGSGKSTIARAVAVTLGLRYLDTGAMYRAVTAAALERHIDVHDAAAAASLADLARTVDLALSTDPSPARVSVDGRDLTAVIRTAEVTAAVSAVSAV